MENEQRKNPIVNEQGMFIPVGTSEPMHEKTLQTRLPKRHMELLLAMDRLDRIAFVRQVLIDAIEDRVLDE